MTLTSTPPVGTNYTITAVAKGTQVKDKAQGTSCSTLYYVFGADAAVTTCTTTPAAGRVSKCPEVCWGG